MMIVYSSSFLLYILVLLFSYIQSFYCQTINDHQVIGRVLPGCALTENKIYCFGGFTGISENNGIGYKDAINDHIELDLLPFGNFSVLDKSKIQWRNRSNIINDAALGTLGQTATAVLSDGSYLIYGGKNSPHNNQPFAVYHPQLDQWEGITLPNNNTYYIRTQIVNLGNDHIWIWGGEVPTIFPNLTVNMFYIYDYKNGLWPTMQTFTKNVSVEHTATLVNNIVYIIGGSDTNAKSKKKTINPFDEFKTYNSVDGTWSIIKTNGSQPTDRSFHTTVGTDDNKYLIIYGGNQLLNGKFQVCDDVYYVYDIEKNNLQGVDIAAPPGSYTSKRFGHYSTIYKSNYLLLLFGYKDLNTPIADNLNVLDIHNPLQPEWIQLATNTSDTNHSSEQSPNENRGQNMKIIIPATVVPSIVVLSAAAVALFFFIRHRKKKQKKRFTLEKEDPRKLYNKDNFISNSDLLSNGTLVGRPNPSDGRTSLTLYPYQLQDEGSIASHRPLSIKPSEPNPIEKIKPSEI